MNGHRSRPTAAKIARTVLVYVLAVLFAFPIYIVIINSFKTKGEMMNSAVSLPKSFYLGNYVTIFTSNDFISSFLCSLIVVLFTTLFTILLSSLAGYSLARWKSKISNAISLILMSTLFVPFQVYMVSMIVIASRLHMTGNLFGLIVIYVALGMPVPIFLFRSYAKSLPMEIEEAAMIDGCSKMQTFASIVFPLMKPIIATVSVLNALWAWGEFLVAFLVYGNHKPMTIPLSQQYFYGTYNNQWNLIMTSFIVTSIPIVILYIFTQKYIVKGIASGAVKG